MTYRNVMRRPLRSLAACAIFIGFFTTLAGEAEATCFKTKSQGLTAAPQFAAGIGAGAAGLGVPANPSIVGMWNSEFLLGAGPDLFDHAFQQFHSDGTEMMLSRGLPPSLGNVCVGVWKRVGPRSFKLRHMAWNWDGDGQYISTFMMEVTITLDEHGRSYTGTWSSDNLSPVTGEPLPGEHFEGVVRGTRITVD
jgi:hypothetical protein